MSETSDRYHRTKHTPDHRKPVAAKAWELGYEAGWTDAANRWMTTPFPTEPDQDDTTTWGDTETAA